MGRNAVTKERNLNPKKRDLYIVKLTETFKKHGLKKYSMDSIASELKVSKATLYHYFSSKDEMVEIALMRVIGQMNEFENITKNELLSFETRFYKMLELFSNAFTDISNLFLADLQDEYPLLWKLIQQFIDYVNQVLTDFYNNGKQAGVFREIHTAILVISDRMFFNAISDVEFLTKNNITLRMAFDEYFRMKCFGFIKQ
ncbi:MAG TPA: TetR/AcrR family transcriptional regulator [Chitinophagales bacterium]|jgi:AcrR family transcriptional regulator|nr:TetR/AcrR family transcriptional regulator [Saprospirales bacterium]HUM51315.1 TetR/AcrR family transcriptional regulator [Chitinophagales bacterium]